MNNTGFGKGKILVPNVKDMTSWSVIACDQFSSQPEYWRDVEEQVKSNPSTLNMIIPDSNLWQPDLDQRVGALYRAMRTYLRRHMLVEVEDYIYVERVTHDGQVRSGIVGVVDLEEYDYHEDAGTKVRASERTTNLVQYRRQFRENAPLEVSHIILLMDDREDAVMSALRGHTDEMKPLYDFELMKDGGSIRGWLVTAEQSDNIDATLEKLGERQLFEDKYNMPEKETMIYAVGDGNMSLAAAKAHYEALKATLSPEKMKNHPARYALCELVNLNDESLKFEPINRIVFGVDTQNFVRQLERSCKVSYEPCKDENGQECQHVDMYLQGKVKHMWIQKPSSNMVTGTIQNFIDTYVQEFSGKVDYVHGNSIVQQLSSLKDNVGFIFPAMGKEVLFETILVDDILPRKTFSMGKAEDKRFYLECRKIIK